MNISILVEGKLDEAVAQRIIVEAGGRPGTTYGLNGINYIKKKIEGFNGYAQGTPILCLADLADVDPDCPVTLVNQLLPVRNPGMLLRVVVTEIESWLLADRTSIAKFLGVRGARVPYHPEDLPDPKASVVDLARQSRFEGISHGLVPADPTQHAQGPGYTLQMREFVSKHWRPSAAAKRSESLARCLRAVAELIEQRED
jgi:hypothetical protein